MHGYQRPEIQRHILEHGNREDLIDWLTWNDPNGSYRDADHRDALGYFAEPLTLETARATMREILARDV